MKKKQLKLLILMLVLFLPFFFVKDENSYAIYRDTLNTKVYLTVLDSNTNYTITFNSHGGGDIDPIIRSYNESIGTLPIPSKEGYNFDGWYTGENGTGTKISSTNLVTASMTVHANYIKLVCKKATTLHSYNNTTFGTIPNSTVMSAGFAYDCDVNDDGVFDSTTERFYYMLTEDGNAVLIYYNNVSNGTPACHSDGILYNTDRLSYEAPTNAYNELPDASVWSNVQLHNLPIQILNQNGGTTAYGHTIETFSYPGKSSRFATAQEIIEACNLSTISTTYPASCRFLLENTAAYGECRSNFWLTTPVASANTNGLYRSTKDGKITMVDLSNQDVGYAPVRPVIEVPENQIEYYDNSVFTTYIVSFDSQGGTPVDSIERHPNEAVGTLPTTTRSNYTFDGWWTDTNYTTQITASTSVTATVTYYAKWIEEVNTLPVVFYIPGTCVFHGKPVSGNNNYITSASNDCISTINPSGSNIDYTATGNNYIDTQIALYSQDNYSLDYEIGFTIEHYAGSEQNEGQATILCSNLENESLLWPGVVFRRDKTTNNVEISQRVDTIKSQQSFNTIPTTVKIVRVGGVVKYSLNGGELVTLQSVSGEDYLTANDYFDFYTWFGAGNTGGDRTATTSNAQRYLVGTLSNMYIKLGTMGDTTSYTVTFDPQGGTVSPTSQTVPSGTAIGTLPTPQLEHYTFAGWYTDPNGGTEVTSSTIVNSTVTYYAHYNPIEYTISFDSQGGSSVGDMTRAYNTTLGSLPAGPTKTHYIFAGWYTDPEGGTEVTSSTVVTGTVTYYAHYTPVNYTISFDSQGGSSVASIERAYNAPIGSFPTNPTKTDLVFAGWWTDTNYTTEVTTSTIVTGPVTLYAKWITQTTFTVTFNTQDGSAVAPYYREYGEEVGTLPVTTKTYYVFDGWYTDPDYVEAVTPTTVIKGDVTFYAKWVLDPIYVASIGNVYYETIEAAVTAAPANTETTITILRDVELSEYVSIGSTKNIVIDLNDHNINNSAGSAFENNGILTIDDSGTTGSITGGYFASNKFTPVVVNKAGHTLNIIGGTITSDVSQVLENNGTMNMSGGKITIGDVAQGVVNNYGSAVLNMTGGEISAPIAGSKRQAIYNKATVNISGDAVLSSASTDRATVQNDASGASITISGGTIRSTNADCARGAVQNISGASVTVTGGTIISSSTKSTSGGIQNAGTLVIGTQDGSYDTSTPVIQGKTYGVNSSTNYSVYDGIIKGATAAVNDPSKIPSTNIESGTNAIDGTETIDSTPYYTLYYELISGFRVTLDPNGGSVTPTSKVVAENDPVGSLPTPDRTGFVFDGWYTPGGVLVTDSTIVDDDITYTARWVQSVINANITNASTTLLKNATETINVTNASNIEPYTYSSNDTSIATVSSSGVITATGPGITQIVLTGDSSGEKVHVIVHVDLANDIETFDIMPAPMRTYFNNIDIWADGATDDDHSTYDMYMNNNLSLYNCINFNGDDRQNKSTSTGTVYCDQPKQYDTGVTGDVIVYEYNPNTNSNIKVASYVTADNGKLYNMIPGTTYYWESVNDSSQNGKFYAFGERRIITIDNLKKGSSDDYYQTRNVRDLGGIDVEYEDAQGETVTGTIKYEKLYRGEKIWGGEGDSIQYFEKLGINHEMDLRADNEPVSNEEDSFASGNKIIASGNANTFEIIHYKIEYSQSNMSNYTMAREALISVMNAFINDPDYALYFHCRIGADRTGTLAYLLEGLLGVSEEDRYRDYEMTVFFGLDERTRFYYNKGSNTNKFVYMKQAIRDASLDGTEDVLEWFLKGSSNRTSDIALVNSFRDALINKN